MKQPKSFEKLRPKVQEILNQNCITDPPVPVEELAEVLDTRVRYSPFDGELAGMLYRDEGQRIIGVNSFHHPNRQRFTIAHELGHLCLHKGNVHIDRTFGVKRRDENSSLAIDPEEIEANRFAAELLMPYDMLMTDLEDREIDLEEESDIIELAERYQVSVQAMTLRIMNILHV